MPERNHHQDRITVLAPHAADSFSLEKLYPIAKINHRETRKDLGFSKMVLSCVELPSPLYTPPATSALKMKTATYGVWAGRMMS